MTLPPSANNKGLWILGRKNDPEATCFSEALNEQGAVDLASIIVGSIVAGVLGTVVAAAVFGVVPWTQDNAAKASLGEVKTAQTAYASMNAAYSDKATLTTYGMLQPDNKLNIISGKDNMCYLATYVSAAGKVFWATDMTEPTLWVEGATSSCPETKIVVSNGSPAAVKQINPTSSFGYVSVGGNAKFDGSASADVDGQVVKWDWVFGDGTTGTGKNVDHSYNISYAGQTVPVQLTTTDNEGNTSTVVSNPVSFITPNQPTALSCTRSSGLIAVSIPLTWTAPSGPAPSSYTLKWNGVFSSGERTVIGTSYDMPGSLLSLFGSSSVKVYANYGNWQSTEPVEFRRITTLSALGLIVSWSCS